MNCDQFRRNIEELAMAPDFELPPEMLAHQQQCDACRAVFSDHRDAWNLLATALPPESISDELEDRIFARIESAPRRTHNEQRSRFWSLALAASVFFALVSGSIIGSRLLAPKYQVANQDLQRVKEFAEQMGKLEQLESTFANPETRYVSLNTFGERSQVQGYLVYDGVGHKGHFFGFDLKPPQDQHLVLWLLSADESVLSSSEIDVDSQGLGATFIDLPADLTVLNEVVVSIEADPSANSPSSSLLLRSKVEL